MYAIIKGWNNRDHFHCNNNGTADTIVATGLAAAGYEYLNLTDCWQRNHAYLFINKIHNVAFDLLGRERKTYDDRSDSLSYETKDANTCARYDTTKMSATTLSTLTNPEVIVVNPDPLVIQEKKVALASSSSSNASSEVLIANFSSISLNIESKCLQ